MQVPAKFMLIAQKLREFGASEVEIAELWDKINGDVNIQVIYDALREINPELARNFLKEMRLVVWRSDMKREHFNRKRIVASLVKEVNLPRGLAERIAREVEEKIRNSDFSIITSTLIRELVLSKLLEISEDYYLRYMRLGIPIFDLETLLERGEAEKVPKRIFRQYILLHVLPKRAAEYVMDGVLKFGTMDAPCLPYAITYYSRGPSMEKWLSGFLTTLYERRWVDVPSIFVPAHLLEDVLPIANASPTGIFWTDGEEMGKIKHSEIPLYSFGPLENRVVRELVTVDVGKLGELTGNVVAFWKGLEEILEGIKAFMEFKKKLVKKGETVVKIEGLDRVEKDLMIQKEKVLENFSEYTII